MSTDWEDYDGDLWHESAAALDEYEAACDDAFDAEDGDIEDSENAFETKTYRAQERGNRRLPAKPTKGRLTRAPYRGPSLRSEFQTRIGAGALAGAFYGGTVAAIKNGKSVIDGNMEPGEALLETGKATIQSSARGALGNAAGVGIRRIAANAAIPVLRNANVAVPVGFLLLDVSTTGYDFVTGQISGEEAVKEIGKKTLGAAGSFAGAVIGQMLIPIPFVGVAVGATIGSLLMNELVG